MDRTGRCSTSDGSGGAHPRRSVARSRPATDDASSRAVRRRCDAHHLQPWALGGHTSLEGLVLLCRRHHTAVHEGGFRIERARDGTVTIWRPDGTRIEAAPRPPDWAEQDPRSLGPTQERLARVGRTVGAHTTSQAWRGERIAIGWAIDVLRNNERAAALTTG